MRAHHPVCLALLIAAFPARAGRDTSGEAPQNCYGEAEAAWVYGDTFVALTNPLGFENQIRLGRCWPLGGGPGILFAYANIETGIFHNISVPYSQQGLYASLTPLSFLNFRIETAGVALWPVPGMAGIGHFSRSGYGDRFPSDGLTHDIDVAVAGAGGFNITLGMTLQLALTLKELSRGKLELLAFNTLGAECWSLGHDSYYYNQRKDVILARDDWALTNFGVLMVGIPIKADVSLRAGVFDNLLYVPAGGVVGNNQVGAMMTFYLEKIGDRVRGLQPFLQVACYTNHSSRRLTFPMDFVVGIDFAVMLH